MLGDVGLYPGEVGEYAGLETNIKMLDIITNGTIKIINYLVGLYAGEVGE